MVKLIISFLLLMCAVVDVSEANSAELECSIGDMECRAFADTLPSFMTVEYPVQDDGGTSGSHTPFLYGDKLLVMSDWDREQARRCLTLVSYAEGRSEGLDGLMGVQFTVLNRVDHSKFSNDICSNIAKSNAFEGVWNAQFKEQMQAIQAKEMPKKMKVDNIIDDESLHIARLIAFRIIEGRSLSDPTNGATHFWSPSEQENFGRQEPYWASMFPQTATIKLHQFYREPG